MKQFEMDYNKNTNEVLTIHEPFFINDVSIFSHKIFCGDERKPLTNETYIHVFGGAANTAYNAEILARATENGVRHSSFKSAVGSATSDLSGRGVAAGVHSDTHSEVGGVLDPEGQDEIGCGYIKLRRSISQKIAENRDAILDEALRLRPELFTEKTDLSFGESVVDSHAELASNDEFFGFSSRDVAEAALENDAPTMLVEGEHTADKGIINLIPTTTIDSARAITQKRSIYVHDAWAGEAMAKEYSNAKVFVGREWQIADLIDAIGTMWALGVKTIAIRR